MARSSCAREVDVFLRDVQARTEGKEKLVAIHGNRLLLYLVFKALGPDVFDADDAEVDLGRIPIIAADCLTKLTAEIMKNYSGAYPASLFKNITKCKAVAATVG